jgi:hypothetical protein
MSADDKEFDDVQGCIVKGKSDCGDSYPTVMKAADDTEYCCDDVGADPDTFNLTRIDGVINGTITASNEETQRLVVDVAATAAEKILDNIPIDDTEKDQPTGKRVGGSALDTYLTKSKLTMIFLIISVFTIAIIASYILSKNPCGGKNLGKGKTGFGELINSSWFFGGYQNIFYKLISAGAYTQTFNEVIKLFSNNLYDFTEKNFSGLREFEYKRIILIALASYFYSYNYGPDVVHGSTLFNTITGNWMGVDDPSGHTFMATLLALDPDLAKLLTDLEGNSLIRKIAVSAIAFGGLLAFLMTVIGGFHWCRESLLGIVMGIIFNISWEVVWPALSGFLPEWISRFLPEWISFKRGGGSRRKSKKLKRVKRKTNKRKTNKRKTKRKTNKRKTNKRKTKRKTNKRKTNNIRNNKMNKHKYIKKYVGGYYC